MKKTMGLFFAVLLAVSLSACGQDGISTTPSVSPGESGVPSGAVSPNLPDGRGDLITEDPSGDMAVGTLFAVFSAEDMREADFGYEADACDPVKIATALSAWTGLNFSITYEYNQRDGAYTVDWMPDSSFATGMPPETQKEDFFFYDVTSLRLFMLNSLCRSIRENIPGNVDVYYSMDGQVMDGDSLELDLNFTPTTPYNRMENPNVLG